MMDFAAFAMFPVALMAGFVGYQMGLKIAEWPSEEEMLKRIKDLRLKQRLELEVGHEIDRELR